jgi:hypothetical protein
VTRILEKYLVIAMIMMVILTINASNLKAEDAGTAAYHPVVTVAEGSVMVMGLEYSIWEPAPVGTLLLSGDKVKTGWGSRAEIRFMSGVVQLYENTLLIVPSIGVQDRKKDIQEVVVEKGDALFDINPLGVQRQFEFRTKNVQGGVKGTVFLVSYINDGTTVGVYDGTVWVSRPGRGSSKVSVLGAGNTIRVEGEDEIGNVRGFDPDFEIEDYSYNVPSGLDAQSRLPADYNADPDNNGVRTRPLNTKKSPTELDRK